MKRVVGRVIATVWENEKLYVTVKLCQLFQLVKQCDALVGIRDWLCYVYVGRESAGIPCTGPED